jgi:hypothetical protein
LYENKNLANLSGIILGLVHLTTFGIAAHAASASDTSQGNLFFIPFFLLDLPVSLLYLIPTDEFFSTLDRGGHTLLAQVLYPPYIISGLLGSLWWAVLPKFAFPRRQGGFWR